MKRTYGVTFCITMALAVSFALSVLRAMEGDVFSGALSVVEAMGAVINLVCAATTENEKWIRKKAGCEFTHRESEKAEEGLERDLENISEKETFEVENPNLIAEEVSSAGKDQKPFIRECIKGEFVREPDEDSEKNFQGDELENKEEEAPEETSEEVTEEEQLKED